MSDRADLLDVWAARQVLCASRRRVFQLIDTGELRAWGGTRKHPLLRRAEVEALAAKDTRPAWLRERDRPRPMVED